MTALNKGYSEETGFWYSNNYCVMAASGEAGYDIVNRDTGQVEAFVEQEPAAIITMLYLQDAYDEVMRDPEREFKLRKDRMKAAQVAPTPQHKVIM